jgi:type II secretory pathway component PulK
MTADEFAQVEDALTVSTDAERVGLVNVNRAPEAVLACVPGIGTELAASVVATRAGKTWDERKSLAWVATALDRDNAIQAGPYLTTREYQFSADVAAVGQDGRGFARCLFVFDTSQGDPRVAYRRDLTALGWALGSGVWDEYDTSTNGSNREP